MVSEKKWLPEVSEKRPLIYELQRLKSISFLRMFFPRNESLNSYLVFTFYMKHRKETNVIAGLLAKNQPGF